jgi:hypothetical protein
MLDLLLEENVNQSIFTAMPVNDQMRLQWRFITAGLETIK